MTCDCGQPELDQMPCPHLYAVCMRAGHNIEDYLDPKDTVAGWKRQYPENFEYPQPPSSAASTCEKPTHQRAALTLRSLFAFFAIGLL